MYYYLDGPMKNPRLYKSPNIRIETPSRKRKMSVLPTPARKRMRKGDSPMQSKPEMDVLIVIAKDWEWDMIRDSMNSSIWCSIGNF